MSLRVIVVDDEADRAQSVRQALEGAGFVVVATFGTGADLPRKLAELAADVVIVDIDSPDRDTLEDMRRVTMEQRRPVVMFAQDGKPETIKAAIEAGVAAYVVDGLKPDRVRPVVDVAIARFAQFQELRGELDKARTTLAERKLIEKAKGILMKRRKVDEDEAYGLMRRMSMDQKSRLIDVANKIIEAAELLG
ncbi:putative response regulator receiver and ANTAR domain protein (Response regulator NasR) [Magnetospirillum gryphiswaldense MSR-1 v2]|uniref:Response regulator receiver and ANTAR domain protein (Response regulator NasR) n=1 Tax=Magnetospirillum gryphiswaldense (strain DSM 6361 / JCM 21280 / NBRC 15271 / MSR-1) TaxID=431944 RepID=V6EZE0_MAGGM|nr:ANTAR domain-containing protein [Magnetospirillum gryphiswaldense]CDK97401.1 putative response regulator receiver and ANTAR domain protein (Response regulator NasR) [Magnetospirillum gryphiswaldense MSR-1 v2]